MRDILNKHSALIHTGSKLSLVQKKLNNILLKHSFYELGKKEQHSIRLKDLVERFSHSGKYDDKEYLKENLRKLQNKPVEFNVLGKDKQNPHLWVSMSLYAEISIDYQEGLIKYSYPPTMRKILKNPNIYARLNLSLQREFTSQYTITLWELLEEHYSRNNEMVFTDWIELAKFKKIMGVDENKYKEFKYFNLRIIKDPIKELNEKSDLEVEVEFKKVFRRVTEVRFKVFKKAKHQIQQSLEGLSPQDETDEKVVLIRRLIEDYSVSDRKAGGLVNKNSIEQIEINLLFVDEQVDNGSVRNVGAFTVKVIEDNLTLKKNKFDKEDKRRGDIYKEIKKIEIEIEDFDKKFDDYSRERGEREFKELAEERQKEIIKVIKKDYHIRSNFEEMAFVIAYGDISKENKGEYVKDFGGKRSCWRGLMN